MPSWIPAYSPRLIRLHLDFVISDVLISFDVEYLYLSAVRTQYASEFGHLIRVITIYARVEYALDGLNGMKTRQIIDVVQLYLLPATRPRN